MPVTAVSSAGLTGLVLKQLVAELSGALTLQLPVLGRPIVAFVVWTIVPLEPS